MLGIRFEYKIMESDKTGEVWIRITPILVNEFASDETGIRGASFDFPLDMKAFQARKDEAQQSLANSLQLCLVDMLVRSSRA